MERKYNILFISTDFNYFIDDNASFHRMYNNLNYFYHHNNYNVVVLQPYRNCEKEKHELKKNIKTYYFREIRILMNNFVPFIDFNPFFLFKVRKIIHKHSINLIHIDFIYGINGLKIISKIPISYNAHNVEAVFQKKVGKYYHKIPFFLRTLYSKYIFLLEKHATKFVKNINAISNLEKFKFARLYEVSEDKIILNNIGYKLNIFNNPISKSIAREKLNLDQKKFIVIFHGSYYTNYANQEAIKLIKNNIAPLVKDEDILFLIAGKIPQFKNRVNLKFLGYIDDLKDFLYAADIAIVPILRGTGIKTKIIDYLSANIPIITTKQGIEGLFFKNGVHGYIINNPIEELIEKILYLKNNSSQIDKFKINIRKLISEKYNWIKILDKIEKRYKDLIEHSSDT